MSEPANRTPLDTVVIARRLWQFARVLLAGYLVVVFGYNLPLRLADPVWQMRITTTLLDNATIPLVGMGLAHLAAYLNPDDLQVRAGRDRVARLAILAMLGFFLLIPLQGVAAWQVFSQSANQRNREQVRANGRIEKLQQAVRSASSRDDLIKRLQALGAPPLTGEINQPLPQLQKQLLVSLEGAKREIDQTADRQRAGQPWQLVGQSLRNMLLAILFGLGFGSAAQRRGSELPLTVEWPLALSAWLDERQQQREARGVRNTETCPQLDQMLSDLGVPPTPGPTTSTPSVGMEHDERAAYDQKG